MLKGGRGKFHPINRWMQLQKKKTATINFSTPRTLRRCHKSEPTTLKIYSLAHAQ
jgi:hypothetical protein